MTASAGHGKTVLIIEDDQAMAALMGAYLEHAAYTVETAETAEQGIEVIQRMNPHVILLDLMLPSTSGWEVLAMLRSRSDVPVIMVTGMRTEEDRLRGFEQGADDYVVKPFSPRELVARVGAVLRRSTPGFREPLMIGPLAVDPQRREVRVDGERISLREREFDLVAYLASRHGTVCSRAELLDQVWGYDFRGDERTIDTHVRRVREALGAAGAMIGTVWGIGYQLDDSSSHMSDSSA
ncbi:MAG: response regulator transcription factor [Chloroflexota bacterium]